MAVVSFLSNISEDCPDFLLGFELQVRRSLTKKLSLVSEREYLGARFQYSDANLQFFSLPRLSRSYVNYIDNLVGGRALLVDCQNYDKSLSTLLIESSEYLNLLFKSDILDLYCYSDDFSELCTVIAKRKPKLAPTINVKSGWRSVEKLGTKSGFRSLLTNKPDKNLLLPDGKVFTRLSEALDFAASEFIKTGVVIKTDKACAGLGVVIVKLNQMTKSPTINKKIIIKHLKAQGSFWGRSMVVVERYIDLDLEQAGGSPFVGGLVQQNQVKILFHGSVRTRQGKPFGFEISNQQFENDLLMLLRSKTRKVGELLKESGYIGYFDVDFLISKNGQVLLAETNLRRTGSMFAYYVGKKLFGDCFLDNRYLLTHSLNNIDKKFTIEDVLSHTQGLLFNKELEVGYIPTTPSLISEGRLPYLILAKDKAEAESIERRLVERLTDS